MKHPRRHTLPFFLLGVACTFPAEAYLDPGTGSVILQGIIAAVAAVAGYAGLYRQRLGAWLRRLWRRQPPAARKDEAGPPRRD